MPIKTYDAFSRLSINDIDRITNFLHKNSGEYKDTKRAIRKSILYAAKEIPGLGGYVFVKEEHNEILGVIVVNRTGMNEYIPENLLVYVAVKEGARRQGIGKALIKYAKAYCKGDIGTYINVTNPVIKLFEKEGFKLRNVEMRFIR